MELFTFVVFAISAAYVNSDGLFIKPDFESPWYDISASSSSSTCRKDIAHGLGETPLLVDVQVKAIDGNNNGFMFQATGHQIRDDDQPEDYANVVYLYNNVYVSVSAPLENNNHMGRVLYTGSSPYWEGPYSQSSTSAKVKVRAWKASTLPSPDYSATGIAIEAQSSTSSKMYQDRSHGLGEYPALVVSRTQFPNSGNFPQYYADSMGSTASMYYDLRYQDNGYVVYGYNSASIRVWVPSGSHGRIFQGGDGHALSGQYSSGTLELYAWKASTLTPNVTGTHGMGPSVSGSNLKKSFTSVGTLDNTFSRAWVQSTSGANNGYRFIGSGALAYETSTSSTPCSYGGLTYAYSANQFRFWQPGSGSGSSNGKLICIADHMSQSTNDQGSSDGTAVYHVWELDTNECASTPCLNGATCTNYAWGYTCTCASGWTGTTCNTDINECSSNPCQNGATCNNNQNSYSCTCAGGWTGTTCATDVNECSSSPCGNGATCINGQNQYTCTCAPGWTGTNCNTDFDECSSSPCQNGASCNNGQNEYTCTCAGGWTGTLCDTDINECASNPCVNGASCSNGQNQYTCTCAAGWQGTNCDTDINECSSNPCYNGATCNNLQNHYTCTCTGGWTGTLCNTDINECSSNPCQNGATCNNNQNSYSCTCAGGWTGTTCATDVNECSSSPCGNGATCTNGQNQYTCTCTPGWTGTNCNTDIDECSSSPCQNGASCNNGQNEYTCTCAGGWTGTLCDTDINECASNPCVNGASCSNGQNQYTCTCAAGWQGTNCDTDINECSSNPCYNGATCNNLQNHYTCTCTGGWTGTLCNTDIDECSSNPCQNSATCTNGQNRYTCTCTSGWQGTDCDTDVDECASNPCLNGATCNNGRDMFTCDCTSDWTGTNCEIANRDGEWGAWQAWGACTKTCGSGRTMRLRYCDNPTPLNGAPCMGDAMTVDVCNTVSCTGNGTSTLNGFSSNTCPTGFFPCKAGSIVCIPSDYRCDCSYDCDDQSDETVSWGVCNSNIKELCDNGGNDIRLSLVLSAWIFVARFSLIWE